MQKYIFLFLFSFLFLESSAQKMYAFLVVQDDATVGTYKDKETVVHLWKTIAEKVRKLDLEIITINSKDLDEERIRFEIDKLPITDDDVIWFYYTGHGVNYDTWPMTDETELPLSKVYNCLQESGARLTITMYDSCNWRDPIAPPPIKEEGWIKTAPNYYQFLFLYSKGHIKVASCSSKQFSYGSANSGSFFTNAFNDAIEHKATWKEVLDDCKQLTESLATANRRTQNPKFEFSSTFKDGNHF